MKGSDLILAGALRGGSGGGGGDTPTTVSAYDAEILFTQATGYSDYNECEILSGSYASIRALIDRGIMPNILCRFYHEQFVTGAVSNAVAIYLIDDSSTIELIRFVVQIPLPNAGDSTSARHFNGIMFDWNANDIVNLA